MFLIGKFSVNNIFLVSRIPVQNNSVLWTLELLLFVFLHLRLLLPLQVNYFFPSCFGTPNVFLSEVVCKCIKATERCSLELENFSTCVSYFKYLLQEVLQPTDTWISQQFRGFMMYWFLPSLSFDPLPQIRLFVVRWTLLLQGELGPVVSQANIFLLPLFFSHLWGMCFSSSVLHPWNSEATSFLS